MGSWRRIPRVADPPGVVGRDAATPSPHLRIRLDRLHSRRPPGTAVRWCRHPRARQSGRPTPQRRRSVNAMSYKVRMPAKSVESSGVEELRMVTFDAGHLRVAESAGARAVGPFQLGLWQRPGRVADRDLKVAKQPAGRCSAGLASRPSRGPLRAITAGQPATTAIAPCKAGPAPMRARASSRHLDTLVPQQVVVAQDCIDIVDQAPDQRSPAISRDAAQADRWRVGTGRRKRA